MQALLAILLVLSVTYVSSASVPGGFSEPIKKPFPKDDALIKLIPQLQEEILTLAAAKLPKSKNVLNSTVNVEAYTQQVVAGKNYNVLAEIAEYIFLVRINAPLSGKPVVKQLVGPLVDGFLEHLTNYTQENGKLALDVQEPASRAIRNLEHVVGGFSEVIKPPFAKDDALIQLIPQVEKEIRSQAAAKAPQNKDIPTAPVIVKAYKKQIVSGTNYNVLTELAKDVFAVRIYAPLSGSPVVQKVVGPLVNGLSDLEHLNEY